MPRNAKAIHSELYNIMSERGKINRRDKVLLNRERKLLLELKKCLTSRGKE